MAQFISRPYNNTRDIESIIFFGMGPVSLSSLKQLHDSFSIEAIITKPDNHKQKAYSVANWAEENHIPYFQPHSSKEITKLFEEKGFLSKAGVVIDYGLMIPNTVINSFPLGIVNSHFSLLPQWRGADPITFALLSGQNETGVTIMKIASKLDTGDILASGVVAISRDDTNESLTSKLVRTSSDLLIKVLPAYIAGKHKNLVPQDELLATYSRKLLKSDGKIDWHKEAEQIEREIRAYYPWPTSYTVIDGQQVSIKMARVLSKSAKQHINPGTFLLNQSKQLMVVCKNGSLLAIEELKPSGKSFMDSTAFLAGRQSFARGLKVVSL